MGLARSWVHIGCSIELLLLITFQKCPTTQQVLLAINAGLNLAEHTIIGDRQPAAFTNNTQHIKAWPHCDRA